MKKIISVALIALILLTLFMLPSSLLAQGPDVYDFTISDYGFTPITDWEGATPPTTGYQCATTYIPGTGFRSDGSGTCGDSGIGIWEAISINFGVSTPVYQVTVEGYYNLESTPYDPVVYSLGLRDLSNRQTSLGSVSGGVYGGGPFSLTITLNSSVNGFYIITPVIYNSGCCFNYSSASQAFITKVTISHYAPTATPTITPSSTPTIAPTPLSDVYSHRICLLLANRAEFRAGWTFTGGAANAYTDPTRFLTLPPGGNATLTLALSPTKKYGVSVLLRAAQTGDNGTITLGIGTSAAYSIPVEGHTDLRGFTTEAITYEPDTDGGYTVTFSRPANSTGNVIIEYFCPQVKNTDSDGGNASDGSGSSSDRCSTCVAPDWFGDIGGILNWLICQLKNLISCYLAQFLIWIQGGIAKLTGFALDIFIWLVDGFNSMVAWVQGIPAGIVRFFGGTTRNTVTGASNAFHTSGIASGMNIVASGARDLPTTLYNIFNGLIGQVGSAIVQSGSLIEIILKLIVVAFSAIIFALFGLVPIIISSLLTGFFTPSNITSLSMSCTNPSSYVYYPCLIFYALDNTVLAGPAGYLFPITMGLWAVQTFVWALNRVKEEVSG